MIKKTESWVNSAVVKTLVQLLMEGRSFQEIADHFGRSVPVIKKAIGTYTMGMNELRKKGRKLGICHITPVVRNKPGKTGYDWESQLPKLQSLVDAGKSQDEIGDLLGKSQSTIGHVIKKYGVVKSV